MSRECVFLWGAFGVAAAEERELFTPKRALSPCGPSYCKEFGGGVLKLMEIVIEFEHCQTKGLKQLLVIYYNAERKREGLAVSDD